MWRVVCRLADDAEPLRGVYLDRQSAIHHRDVLVKSGLAAAVVDRAGAASWVHPPTPETPTEETPTERPKKPTWSVVHEPKECEDDCDEVED